MGLAAASEYRRALVLNPANPTAHEWYGLFLAAMGRFDEAQVHERCASADPLSLGVASTAGWVLHYSGKQADAERQLRIAVRTDSTFPVAHLYLGRVLQFSGQLDSALAHFGARGSLRAWVPTIAGEGYVYAQQGRREHAQQVLARLDSLSRTQYVTPYAVALVHAALGQSDSAFVWLNKAVDERTHWVLWLNRDRRWDPIRSDDRFRAIVRRVGFRTEVASVYVRRLTTGAWCNTTPRPRVPSHPSGVSPRPELRHRLARVHAHHLRLRGDRVTDVHRRRELQVWLRNTEPGPGGPWPRRVQSPVVSPPARRVHRIVAFANSASKCSGL